MSFLICDPDVFTKTGLIRDGLEYPAGIAEINLIARITAKTGIKVLSKTAKIKLIHRNYRRVFSFITTHSELLLNDNKFLLPTTVSVNSQLRVVFSYVMTLFTQSCKKTALRSAINHLT